MIHFIRPSWLFILLPILLYFVWLIYSSRQANPWKQVCDPHLLTPLLQTGSVKSQKLYHISLLLFFVVSVFALSGPSWKHTSLLIYRDVSTLMLVLDLSPSMLADDLKPNRLERAKFKIHDLINTAQNLQMGLVVFTSESFVVSPVSKDATTLDAMIDELNPQMMPVAGSDISEGLSQATQLLSQVGMTNGNILLITASEPTDASYDIAKKIASSGGRLNVLAMLADDQSNRTVVTQLQQLANTGNGTFYLFTPGATDIQGVISNLQNHHAVKDDSIDNALVWEDAGPWFCLLLLPLGLLILREKSA